MGKALTPILMIQTLSSHEAGQQQEQAQVMESTVRI